MGSVLSAGLSCSTASRDAGLWEGGGGRVDVSRGGRVEKGATGDTEASAPSQPY
jgi:hypothetical protein